MEIKKYFHKDTNTFTYIVFDNQTKDAIIIDPVMDYDIATDIKSDTSAKEYIQFIKENNLNLHYCLDTHVHVDHLTGSYLMKKAFPKMQVAIQEAIVNVQNIFKDKLEVSECSGDGSEFDLLLKDGDKITAGSILIDIIHTPGHTPACTSFKIGNTLFTGDAMFMPDFGTGRCDFPGASASDLYDSITQKLYTLPDETKVYVGHDYGTGGREVLNETTIGDAKKNNIQLKENTSKEEFVEFRTKRDAGLNEPKLLVPSLKVNILAGKVELN